MFIKTGVVFKIFSSAFVENGQEFYPGYPGPGFGDFFPGQGPEMPPGMPLLPHQGRGTPPIGMEHQMPPGGM